MRIILFLLSRDNIGSLINGIKMVLRDKNLADKISRQGYLDIQNYTWRKRAINILNFIYE